MELKLGMSDKHYWHSKHTKFRQNLRGPLQFFSDWAWNDLYAISDAKKLLNIIENIYYNKYKEKFLILQTIGII